MPHQVLTERQHEVLALMLQLKKHRQIAAELGIATRTVLKHMIDIWDRLCEPRNREYALHLLRALCEARSDTLGQVIAFSRLRIGQRFRYQGQLFERVDRARDQAGAYNAVTIPGGHRNLFRSYILMEVVSHE